MTGVYRPRHCHGRAVTAPTVTVEQEETTKPDRAETARRWRADEARRIAVMGEHAGTAEGIRRLVAAGELSEQAGATLLAVLR